MRSLRRLCARLRDRISRSRRSSRGLDEAAYRVSVGDALAAGAASTDLGRILFEDPQRPIYKWVQYLAAYEREFASFRDLPVRILEIGVYKGGSLELWHEYFGQQAVIYGIDINPECAQLADERTNIRIGSQDDPDFLASVLAEMGEVDIIIDDGSHVAAHQRTSFDYLFPRLADGGVYVVEDLHTSYWRDYGGGYRRSGSFIEYIKTLIDDMHLWYHPKGQRSSIDASHSIPRISLYDSVAFIYKATKPPPAVFFLDPEMV